MRRRFGFGIDSHRAQNPGDLKIPDWSGPTLGKGFQIQATMPLGARGSKQLYAIVTGLSDY